MAQLSSHATNTIPLRRNRQAIVRSDSTPMAIVYEAEVGVDPQRFIILAIFCSASFGSALGWLSFVSISDLAEWRFDVGPSWINLIANMFGILYIPGSILSLWVVQRHGLAKNILIGIFLNFAMCIIKYVGTLVPDPRTAFGFIVVGQIFGAFAQPMICNVAARLSMDWFPETERDIATTAATMSNILGQMVASFVPALICGTADGIQNVGSVEGLTNVMLYQVYLFATVVIVALICLEDRPRQPPSPAAALQWLERARSAEEVQEGGYGFGELMETWANLVRELWANTNFMLLWAGFAVGTGTVWAVLIVEQQMITPCGYTDFFSGVCGAALLASGIVAAFIVSGILESTRAYVIIQKVDYAVAMVAVAGVLLMNRPDNATGIVVSWCFLGAALQPLMPITLEHAAEMTYPLPADSSTAVLLIGANIVSCAMIFIITPMLQVPVSAQCESVFTPAAFLVVFLMALGTSLTMMIGQDYRRMAAEHARTLSDLPPTFRAKVREISTSLSGERQEAGGRGGEGAGGSSGAGRGSPSRRAGLREAWSPFGSRSSVAAPPGRGERESPPAAAEARAAEGPEAPLLGPGAAGAGYGAHG